MRSVMFKWIPYSEFAVISMIDDTWNMTLRSTTLLMIPPIVLLAILCFVSTTIQTVKLQFLSIYTHRNWRAFGIVTLVIRRNAPVNQLSNRIHASPLNSTYLWDFTYITRCARMARETYRILKSDLLLMSELEWMKELLYIGNYYISFYPPQLTHQLFRSFLLMNRTTWLSQPSFLSLLIRICTNKLANFQFILLTVSIV